MIFYGATRQEALECTPRELWPYEDAFKLRMRYEDQMAYNSGYYTMAAVSISLSNAFRGKNTKPEPWLKKTIMQEADEANGNIPEEVKKRKVDAYFHRLEIMKFNEELKNM